MTNSPIQPTAVPAQNLDVLAALLDDDHILLSDDPGDGSGPAFCSCDNWDESQPLSWGAHIATEYTLLLREGQQ